MYIFLATSNANKRIEISNIFSLYDLKNIKIVSFSDFIKPFEIIENGETFAQNAQIKAKAIYEALHNFFKTTQGRDKNPIFSNKDLLVLSEDSGLCIEALGNAPSVYSARFKDISLNGDDTDSWIQHKNTLPNTLDTDSMNIERVIYELQIRGLQHSNATFVANICLFGNIKGEQNLLCEHFEGICKGRVITQKLGNKGFGYDPIFIPEGYTQTLAQITNKDSLSHRKKALAQCVEFLRVKVLKN